MSLDDDSLRLALKFLCCYDNNEDVCRLCLGPTENTAISFAEDLMIQKPYYNGSLTFLDIYHELGLPLDDELPQVFCTDCATIAINTFLFNKLCKYSTENWENALQKLNICIDNAKSIKPDVKVTYLCIDDNIMYTAREKKTNTKASVHLNNIIKFKKMYKERKEKLEREQNGRHYCNMCFKSFISQQKLNFHLQRIHKERKILCPKCDKKFATKSLLKTHDYKHHCPTVCKLCSLQFPSRYELRLHLMKHEVLKCPRCNKQFRNKSYYQQVHLKNCQPREEVVYQEYYCDICNKGYRLKNSLRSHIKVEHGYGNVYTCQWCNKKYDAISRLNAHIVKHTKERNFFCEVCGSKFVTCAALTYHKRLHTGERPYPCDLCDATFLSASRRMEHKHRKHFGPQKACPHCPMKFITKCSLSKHVERHLNPASKLYSGAAL